MGELPKDTELNQIACSKKLAKFETDWTKSFEKMQFIYIDTETRAGALT